MITTHTILTILQQSEYNVDAVEKWVETHADYPEQLVPKWTMKMKLIATLSSLFFFLPIVTRLKIAVAWIAPAEQLVRWSIYFPAKQKLLRLKKRGLIVVAVAGSYGKTSTKTIAGFLLSEQRAVLVTPESYNTLLGIAHIIRRKLTNEHQIFIVEMGEYHPGDIAKLLDFCQPDFGVMVPLGRQHIEILGSFEQLLQEMKDFVSAFRPDNVLIHEANQSHFPNPQIQLYGTTSPATYFLEDSHISRAGTDFRVKLPGEQRFSCFSPLYGEHQAVNVLPTFWLGDRLKLDLNKISKKIAGLPYVPRRHQPTFAANNVLLLDNSYNTNPDSVVSSLQLVKQLEPTKSIVVTLGFVEQGEKAPEIHYQFGMQLAKAINALGLIEGPYTENIKEGFLAGGGSAKQLFRGKDQEDVIAQLRAEIIPGSVILFEGGYQELYT